MTCRAAYGTACTDYSSNITIVQRTRFTDKLALSLVVDKLVNTLQHKDMHTEVTPSGAGLLLHMSFGCSAQPVCFQAQPLLETEAVQDTQDDHTQQPVTPGRSTRAKSKTTAKGYRVCL